MLRLRLLFLFLFICCTGAGTMPAQTATPSVPSTAPSALERLQGYARNINLFNRLFPQEKTYVQTDNTGYYIGETIWLKAYVVRTDRGRLTDLSRVLYVELVDPFGEVVITQKLPLRNGTAEGNIALDKLQTSGFYELRAYTRYATNFDARGTFARTIPIFERPSAPGCYAERVIRNEASDFRRADTTATGRPVVNFYPEGGRLVGGLMSRVAFAILLPDTTDADVAATVTDAAGHTVADAHTLREGRGVFSLLPDAAAPALFSFAWHGKTYHYALPRAEREGHVVTVNTLAGETVSIGVASSPGCYGRTLGLTLTHNGTVEYFDTLHTAAEAWGTTLNREKLAGGLHCLTLFGPDGHIFAERQFFIPPQPGRDVLTVTTAFADSLIAPRRKMELRLTGPAATHFALAVTDAATRTNGGMPGSAAWWLLAGDLRGYVRQPDYYLEADDATHRAAADLLCLVQGWTRYDWRVMAGTAPFVKRQPVEDSLYLNGRIYPRLDFKGSAWMLPKARRRTRDVAGVSVGLVLYNADGRQWRGQAVTDSLGNYAFALPPLTGEWTAILHTTKDGKDKPHVIAIDRLFSPGLRTPDRRERLLVPPDGRPTAFRFTPADYAAAPAALPAAGDIKDVKLGEAVVSWHRGLWTVLRGHIAARSQQHFDMQREADSYADRGEDFPLLRDWLLSRPSFVNAFKTEKRAVGFILNDARRASFWLTGDPERVYVTSPVEAELPNVDSGTIRLHVTYGEDLDGRSTDDSINAPETVEKNGETWRVAGPPLRYIDEIKDLYVSTDDFGPRYMYPYERSYLMRRRPFYVFYFLSYPPLQRTPSSRHTRFEAFNACTTFADAEALRLPDEPDFRRTLYWNPDVALDTAGHAVVSFGNNASCRSVVVTVGGISDTGRPVVGVPAGTQTPVAGR